MTALQWILKEAKKLKKEYPKRFTKWTDYVAQASAIYSSKHKGKSPVGKKKAAKKKVSGVKDSKEIKKTLAKKGLKMPHGYATIKRKRKIGAVKKKAATKTSYHKDTASHNVKISVMSGLNQNIIKRLEHITKEIEQREDVIASVLHRKKDLIAKNGKSWYTKWLKLAKGHIAELKKHKTELKKFI